MSWPPEGVKWYYHDDYTAIAHGDAREIVPTLGRSALLLTDPPYGLNSGAGSSNSPQRARGKSAYRATDWEDTPEYIKSVVVPVVKTALEKCDRGIITPGCKCLFFYPPTDCFGGMWHPAASSYSRWGAQTIQPILYYGKDPRQGKTGVTPNGRQCNEHAPKNGFPCPKPVKFWTWLANKGALRGETILDPFAGSGTTGRCAKDLGCKAILIDREEYACEIAAKRMGQEVLALEYPEAFIPRK